MLFKCEPIMQTMRTLCSHVHPLLAADAQVTTATKRYRNKKRWFLFHPLIIYKIRETKNLLLHKIPDIRNAQFCFDSYYLDYRTLNYLYLDLLTQEVPLLF